MNSLQIRLTICTALVLIFSIIRSFRQNQLIETNDFVGISASLGGIILTGSLFVQGITDEKLLDLIGADGILALLVGTGSQIVTSVSDDLKQDLVFIVNLFTSSKDQKNC
ncbi:MAG: hypothetical protein F6K65_33315 [Moorea sp. SIO3C2]|nr:hypothetical protein [Moorena sp. SIO3C2]